MKSKEENRVEVVLDWTILDCTTNRKQNEIK